MFDKNEFNAMLARRGMSRENLAKNLGIRRETLYRKITNDGSFTISEITKLIELFGKDEVCNALFSTK